LGFYFSQDDLVFAVVTQPFVRATEKTDLSGVKKFMHANGFINTKNNDYRNPDLGIILEDLHDENVLTENGVLQFIDTVFYIEESFYSH
jgi:Serine/Threonine/Tyrosine Kinase found in polyvalent proteins